MILEDLNIKLADSTKPVIVFGIDSSGAFVQGVPVYAEYNFEIGKNIIVVMNIQPIKE